MTEDQRGLAIRYLPMAQVLAGREKNRSLDREELESAAYLALVEAARSFDPAWEVGFATYAQYHIRGALRQHQRFLVHGGWRGDAAEAPVFHGLTVDAELQGWVIGKEPTSPVGRDLEAAELAESWLRRLPARLARICRTIYIDGTTLEEAAEQLGYSRSYLSRLHQDAIDRLSKDRAVLAASAGGNPAALPAGVSPRGSRAPACQPRLRSGVWRGKRRLRGGSAAPAGPLRSPAPVTPL